MPAEFYLHPPPSPSQFNITIRVVPMPVPVSEMPPIQPTMLDQVSTSMQVYAQIRKPHNASALKWDPATSLHCLIHQCATCQIFTAQVANIYKWTCQKT